jgi:hypothetical protein
MRMREVGIEKKRWLMLMPLGLLLEKKSAFVEYDFYTFTPASPVQQVK